MKNAASGTYTFNAASGTYTSDAASGTYSFSSPKQGLFARLMSWIKSLFGVK